MPTIELAPRLGAAVMIRSILGTLLVLCLPVLPAQGAPQDKLCIMCHAAAAATAKDGAAHAGLSCVECHAALKDFDAASGDDHTTPLARVDCSSCHAPEVSAWQSS